MHRTITCSDLPNANLATVGEIPLHYLFPIETVCDETGSTYIHYNGNLFKVFEADQLDSRKVESALKKLPPETSIQIYRYHTPDNESFYVTVTTGIDYQSSVPTLLFGENLLNPIKKQAESICSKIGYSLKVISDFAKEMNLKETSYLQSNLPYLLFDFVYSSETIEAQPARTNMSFIKIGRCRVGTIASINNVSLIPDVRNVINEFTYLQRILSVIPSEKRQKELQSLICDDSILINHLSNRKRNDVSIDTICRELDDVHMPNGRVLYTDIAFFISSDNIQDLKNKFDIFQSKISNEEITLYCHTNTTEAAYISMFPGNEIYADRYCSVYENGYGEIVRKALGV